MLLAHFQLPGLQMKMEKLYPHSVVAPFVLISINKYVLRSQSF